MASSFVDSATRNRSNSGEDHDLSEHDRKRPRLSEGTSDTEQHLPNIISSHQHQSASSNSNMTTDGSQDASSKPALPPRSTDVSMGTSSPTSKVTINTRPISSQSMSNIAQLPADVAVDDTVLPQVNDALANTISPHLPSKPVSTPPHETISISSSPIGSPEIEIAEVEDYDQDPSETKWTKRLGGSVITHPIQPSHVHFNFPFAGECKLGDARQAISRVLKILGDPTRDPGVAFQDVKDFLVNFATDCEALTEDMIDEDPLFWAKLHLIPETLLKRDQQNPTSVGCQDLLDFFVAYGHITKLMLELETRRCRDFPANGVKWERLLSGNSWNYLISATWILNRNCALLSSLQKYHGLDPMLIIRPCCRLLMDPQELNLMQAVNDLIAALAVAILKSPKFYRDFSTLSNPLSSIFSIMTLMPTTMTAADSDTFHATESIRQGLVDALWGLDRLLHDSIRKQCAWLNMEVGLEIVAKLGSMISKLGGCVPQFGTDVIAAAGVGVNDADYDNLELIVLYAWKFMMYHKFLRHGRMELRVCGVERMCADLVQVYTVNIRDKSNGHRAPLVKFLNRFLRETDIIPYVIGVDSHPQILQRSANLVGFLNVSHTYTTADTDVIWRAVTEGQDPRTVHEVLALVARCFETFNGTDAVVDLCRRLMDLPSYRFDARMLEFSIGSLNTLRAKTPQSPLSQYFNSISVYDPIGLKLSMRLLRIVSAQWEAWGTYHQDYVGMLASFLPPSREADRCFAIAEEEELNIIEEIRADLDSHGGTSTSAILIINYILTASHPNPPFSESAKLSTIERCGFVQGLVDDIAVLCLQKGLDECWAVGGQFEARLNGLFLSLTLVPGQFDENLLNILWRSLLTGQSVAPSYQSSAWSKLTLVMKRCKEPNAAIDSILRDFWQKLQPSDFSKALLEFAEQSISYEADFSDGDISVIDQVVRIPGIDRVWTIMLDASPNTLETEATDFVINQYLRNQLVRRATKDSVRATHLDLIDRCVNLVLGSAARLKKFSESAVQPGSDEGDDGMVIIASPDEIRIEESRFDRSLLFLRRFTEAVKGNPGCSPIASRQLDGLPDFPDKKGESVSLTVQVFGNKYVTDAQRKVSVGSNNTGSELWSYVSDVSGFSSFTVFYLGKALTGLRDSTSTLGELKIMRGGILVRKDAETVEKLPTARLRACSPVDEKIILHFDDLYGLLEADNRLAKEVYDFLNITTVREKVSQLARSMQTPAADLLPAETPYKLLFCTQALRSSVEVESFSTTPDAQFLSYAVNAITSAISKLGGVGFRDPLQKWIVYELIDTLLIAFRAKVAPEVFQIYLSSQQHFPELILEYLDVILRTDDQQLESEKLTRASFEALLEAHLQNNASWNALIADQNLAHVIRKAILSDSRQKVRQSILEVLLGLTGSNGPKILLKTIDPRAARARYESSAIEACLLRIWDVFSGIFPYAKKQHTQCQEFFDAALAILRRVGKSFEVIELQSFFDQWVEALLEHENREIVGQPRQDRFVLGITKVIFECVRLLRLRDALPPQSKLMRKIFSKFLFPPLSQSEPDILIQTPILDSEVRESLYDLLIRMCQMPTEVNLMASELADDLVPSEHFESNMSHDRLALRSEIGYAGLRNLSNTCYLNSLWSQLFMNVQFRELLLTASVVDEGQQKLLQELAKVFAHMQSSYDKSIEPSAAVDSIVTYDGENIDVTVQMDVDEFFNLLFDRLETQILDQNAKLHFKSLYGGQTIQQIKSKECEHVSERPEAFAVLPVEIKEKYRLEDSLKAYVEGELLQGDNKYSCTSCGRLVDAVKRSCLREVPDNLIFNLKRFDYDIMTGLRCKLNDHFQFPDTLDMAPYTLNHLSQPDRPIEPDMFELTGIIVHSGTADSGHYYSYIRQRPSAKDKQHSWVQFNDSDVTPFDPGLIQDMCFGGADISWNNLPKFYSAYMLFYQRTSGIKHTERQFMHTDQHNPLRLNIAASMQDHIDQDNEIFLRAYCAQDPAHARFVRQLLERLWESGQGQCSEDHDVEERTLRMALEYMLCISSRTKSQPEMEPTSKLINKYGERCSLCASTILQWFAGDRSLRDSLVKNPFQATRKTFSHMFRSCVVSLSTCALDEPQGEVAQIYQSSLRTVLVNLSQQWGLVARTSRAWTEYLLLLTEIVDVGVLEAKLVLDCGFLQKTLDLVQVHFSDGHDLRIDRTLRNEYSQYLSARERNRPFNHSALITFFARMLFRLDLSIWPNGKHRASPENPQQTGPLDAEVEALGLSVSPYNFHWLERIIAGRTCPAVAAQLVAFLVRDSRLAGAVSGVLAHGLEHKSMPVAVAFLRPVEVFCAECGNLNQILDLVSRFAESVATIGLEFGKEYCLGIVGLLHVGNQSLRQQDGFLQDVLAENISHWAPVLLVAGNDMVNDVRENALELVTRLLLDPLEVAHDEDPVRCRAYQIRAIELAKQAAHYVQTAFLKPNASETQSLQSGHAHQVSQVVDRCIALAQLDNMANGQQFQDIQRVIAELKARADQVVETLSADWQESSEMDALSEEFEDLVSP